MAEVKVDNAAEARKLIAWGEEWMGEEGSTDATNIATAMHAQTHATLALVEQQKRIADWLEAWPLANDESPVVSVNGVG